MNRRDAFKYFRLMIPVEPFRSNLPIEIDTTVEKCACLLVAIVEVSGQLGDALNPADLLDAFWHSWRFTIGPKNACSYEDVADIANEVVAEVRCLDVAWNDTPLVSVLDVDRGRDDEQGAGVW
jgi:hypothetical protein